VRAARAVGMAARPTGRMPAEAVPGPRTARSSAPISPKMSRAMPMTAMENGAGDQGEEGDQGGYVDDLVIGEVGGLDAAEATIPAEHARNSSALARSRLCRLCWI
jgi:hypothetical protein